MVFSRRLNRQNRERPQRAGITSPTTLDGVALADLIAEANKRLLAMATAGGDVTSEKEQIAAIDAQLVVVCGQLKIDVGFCELPGCGRPFQRTVKHAKFCNADGAKCKQIYDNNYRNKKAVDDNIHVPTSGGQHSSTT